MKKKEMIPLTDEENESYEKQNLCYISKKEFNTDENDKNQFNTDENDISELNTDKNDENAFKPYIKSEIIVITLENLEELLMIFVI